MSLSTRVYYFLGLFFLPLCTLAQTGSAPQQAVFLENKGQWDAAVRYKVELATGAIYLENDRITYDLANKQDEKRLYGHDHQLLKNKADSTWHRHAYQVLLKGATVNAVKKALYPAHGTHNYFIGNDKSKWASGVKAYSEVLYSEIYPGIDLRFYLKDEQFKYEFIVKKGSDPASILLEYIGTNGLRLDEGNLKIYTSVDTVIETAPYSYQLLGEKQKKVKSAYQLSGNTVRFKFANAWEKSLDLIIDPGVVFSSYTGSTANNFGFTAAYDAFGNLFAGGYVISAGYPVTIGAYDGTFNGGGFDIGISKFTPDGSLLDYSTYIGGNGDDQPHSLITNIKGELYIFGRSNSSNFPTTAAAVSASNKGGFDIVLCRLSVTGEELLASTYIGGSNDDGVNHSSNQSLKGNTKYNYADDARGEITIDDFGSCYVASCTKSTDFPVSVNAFQTQLKGPQDGCVFRLDSSFTQIQWSTYIGGAGYDAANAMHMEDPAHIYVTGGTMSADFPTTASAMLPTYQGAIDGFVCLIEDFGKTLKYSSFIGTTAYDQSFFVDQDNAGDVYVFGQTTGAYPVLAGPSGIVYSNPNSGAFVQKMPKDLSTSLMSSTFGNGSGRADLVPSAFMVDNCGEIYFSGWGGTINYSNHSLAGFYTSPNAFSKTTDGNDFYFMKLSPNAQQCLYATYFGANNQGAGDHVDGGTSRFDKRGIIYQAVCASCFAPSGFPVTPGVWSSTNKSSGGCNLAAIKFDLETASILVEFQPQPLTICVGDSIKFKNLTHGTSANTAYQWNFGDGSVASTDVDPVHTFTKAGTYFVKLSAFDPSRCNLFHDQSHFVYVVNPIKPTLGADTTICRGQSVLLKATGLSQAVWTPAEGLGSPNAVNTSAKPDTSTTYIVASAIGGCYEKDTIRINVKEILRANYSLYPDVGCAPFEFSAKAKDSIGTSFQWELDGVAQAPGSTFDYTFTTPGTYQLTLIASNAGTCKPTDTLKKSITIIPGISIPDYPAIVLCKGDSSEFFNWADTLVPAASYSWTPSMGISASDDPNVRFYPSKSEDYTLLAKYNDCSVAKKITVRIKELLEPSFTARVKPCSGDATFINTTQYAQGVQWDFGDQFGAISPEVLHTYTDTGVYVVTLKAKGGDQFCDAELQKEVSITALKELGIYVPNVFTPDGDGTNDQFVIGNAAVNCKVESIVIYSRWGVKVYESDAAIPWDGTINGELAPAGVYYYVLKGDDFENPGFVTLLRP